MAPPRTETAAPIADGMLRRVQRTGTTSLAVTLPKSWTEAHDVHTGTVLRFQELAESRLEITPASTTAVEGTPRVLHLDATDAPPQLLARLLVGAYITGQDQIVIVSRHELAPEVREEVERTARRVLGMSLIEDEPTRLEVQVFLDATKHRLPSLVDRVVRMLRHELELCCHGLQTGSSAPLEQVPQVEEEIDRFYLLMARQILLASNDFHIAREIGVPSHHYQFGYRIVAKMLEVTADLLASVAEELGRELDLGKAAPEIRRLLQAFDGALVHTMKAFTDTSAMGAHVALTEIEEAAAEQTALSGTLIGRSRDKEAAARLQRILSSLGTALEMLTIINETTLNRSVEPETVARGGGRAVVARGPAPGRLGVPAI